MRAMNQEPGARPTSGHLMLIRRMALVGVAVSILALPLGLIALASALSPTIGDNGMGDAIAQAVGLSLLILGLAGLILGSVLAVLARRVAADPRDVRGWRRAVLAGGLALAGGEALLALLVGGGGFTLIGPGAAFAAGFLVVAAATRRRVELVAAGALVVALLGSGALVLWGQASANSSLSQRMDRVGLLPPDWSAAVDAAGAAAPDGWAVGTIAAKVTDFAPSESLGYLPPGMAGHPLRGLVVVDCAGAGSLEVVARDGDLPLDATGDSPIPLGTVACDPEPQVVHIQIPDFTIHTGVADYVLRIDVRPLDEGPAGGMNRALLLVARADTPDPDRDALLAAFVAAFGIERPR
jgi:hypothetical protein